MLMDEDPQPSPLQLRNVSTVSNYVTNQGPKPHCWLHTVSRLVTRLLCNVINLVSDDGCDARYEELEGSFAEEDTMVSFLAAARDSCSEVSLRKFYLHVFFFCYMRINFECDTENSTGEVLRHVTKTVLNNRASVRGLLRGTDYEYLVEQQDFVTNIQRTLDEFYGEVDRVRESPGESMFRVIQFRNKLEDLVKSQESGELDPVSSNLKYTFENGLYSIVGVNFGIDNFSREFMKYTKEKSRPVVDEELLYPTMGSHVLIVSEFFQISGYPPNTSGVTLTNSWGVTWGDEGKIRYRIPDEIFPLSPDFFSIAPRKLSLLKQTRTVKVQELDASIYVSDSDRVLIECKHGNIEYMHEHVTDPTILMRPINGRYLIIVACTYGHIELVKYFYLIQPECLHVKDDEGNSPYLAAKENNHDELRSIIYEMAVAESGESGESAFAERKLSTTSTGDSDAFSDEDFQHVEYHERSNERTNSVDSLGSEGNAQSEDDNYDYDIYDEDVKSEDEGDSVVVGDSREFKNRGGKNKRTTKKKKKKRQNSKRSKKRKHSKSLRKTRRTQRKRRL
jgi:hypothetical protein